MQSDSGPMKAYMREIADIPLITRQEEVELAAKIKQGDEAARQRLIKANLRLVVKIAHDYKGYGLPLLDLISEGNIGLMRASEKFDPSKGAKFSSYSAWWIKQGMRRALSQKSRTIRVPSGTASKAQKLKHAKALLLETLGREATDEEVGKHLDFTSRTVKSLKMAEHTTFSLNDPIRRGEEGSFEDVTPDSESEPPDKIFEMTDCINRLRRMLHHLDEREQMILTMRFGLDGAPPKTLEAVSLVINRTRERVRQIQVQALDKLRGMLDDQDHTHPSHGSSMVDIAEPVEELSHA